MIQKVSLLSFSLSLSLSLSLFVRYPFSSLNLRLATEVRLVFRLFARDRVNGTTERRSDAAKHRLSQVAEKKETKKKKKKREERKKEETKITKSSNDHRLESHSELPASRQFLRRDDTLAGVWHLVGTRLTV